MNGIIQNLMKQNQIKAINILRSKSTKSVLGMMLLFTFFYFQYLAFNYNPIFIVWSVLLVFCFLKKGRLFYRLFHLGILILLLVNFYEHTINIFSSQGFYGNWMQMSGLSEHWAFTVSITLGASLIILKHKN